jgi:hypothetical protein
MARPQRPNLTEAAILTETTSERPASHAVKARRVHQEIRTLPVTLPAPRRTDRTLPDVEITALQPAQDTELGFRIAQAVEHRHPQ